MREAAEPAFAVRSIALIFWRANMALVRPSNLARVAELA